ncbi:MAG: SAM-dependent methyltransferase [Pseudomonadota bacterium]
MDLFTANPSAPPAILDRVAILPSGDAAVMSRRFEPDDSLDYFPTPPWATRAVFEYVLKLHTPTRYNFLGTSTLFDPACGEGHMALVLQEYSPTVIASDVFDYGFGEVRDFLTGRVPAADWVFMNPPFNEGLAFIERACSIAKYGVAVLVRTQFKEGVERYEQLFRDCPPTFSAQFVERVPMHAGRWVMNGKTATAYCWLVWITGDWSPTREVWIPPCRRELTHHDDWLRFGGCLNAPKKHPVHELIDFHEKEKTNTLANVRALRGRL